MQHCAVSCTDTSLRVLHAVIKPTDMSISDRRHIPIINIHQSTTETKDNPQPNHSGYHCSKEHRNNPATICCFGCVTTAKVILILRYIGLEDLEINSSLYLTS
jgi:hypothetical protein